MRYIKNYNDYNQKRLIDNNFNSKIELFENIDLNSTDEKLFIDLFNKLLTNYKVDESIKLEISKYISDNQILNEGFFDKLKERFPKAAEVSKKLSDKAESVLNSILQKAKDAISFVKKIGEGIKELFISVINTSKEYFNEQIKGGKLKQKIEEVAKTKKEGLKNDIQEIKKVLNFYRKDFLSVVLSSTEKNMADFLSKEQEPITESMILEKGNVIATLVHGVEKIPPFSWLHKLSKAGAAGASQFVKLLSDATNQMGGPSFTLPVITLIVGVVLEQIVKINAGGWLITLAGATTPLGMAISGMKMVAAFIALLTVIDAVVGEKILGHGSSHKEESSEQGKEESSEEDGEQSEELEK
jgi:hypothetical protein